MWKKKEVLCALLVRAPPDLLTTNFQHVLRSTYTPYEFESGDSGRAVCEECREDGGSRCGLTRSSQAMETWLQEGGKRTISQERSTKKGEATYSDG